MRAILSNIARISPKHDFFKNVKILFFSAKFRCSTVKMHLECVFCAHGSFQDRWNCFPGPLEAKFPILKKYYFFLQKSPIWPYLVPAAKSWYARMAIYNWETKISKIQSTFLSRRSYSSSPCIGGQIRPLWKYPLDIAWGPFWAISLESHQNTIFSKMSKFCFFGEISMLGAK